MGRAPCPTAANVLVRGEGSRPLLELSRKRLVDQHLLLEEVARAGAGRRARARATRGAREREAVVERGRQVRRDIVPGPVVLRLFLHPDELGPVLVRGERGRKLVVPREELLHAEDGHVPNLPRLAGEGKVV